jgi:RND family efflux transporter MFP subunit
VEDGNLSIRKESKEMDKGARTVIHIVLVFLILLSGILIFTGLIRSKPEIKKRQPEEVAPSVKARIINPSPEHIFIEADGTVRPERIINLISEVSGRVIYKSPSLVTGGEFKKGDTLLKIDDRDYVAEVELAKAQLEDARSRLTKLEEESRESRREWKQFSNEDPPPLVLKLPQLEAQKAEVRAREAGLTKAKLRLEKTVIKAPFDGKVLDENVDEGEYVRTGQILGRIFSLDTVEIRVSINKDDSVYLDIPGFTCKECKGSQAIVETVIGNQRYKWSGVIVRSEVIDEKTRMLPVIVKIKNPYKRYPPLSVGMFVRVRLIGKKIPNAVRLPRRSINLDEEGRPYVWIIDSEDIIHRRYITIHRDYKDTYLVSNGLKKGDRVVISGPEIMTSGMKVRPYTESADEMAH